MAIRLVRKKGKPPSELVRDTDRDSLSAEKCQAVMSEWIVALAKR
jgi:hypothetical protein